MDKLPASRSTTCHFRGSAAFGAGDPGFDQQDQLFIYIFVCSHDRDTGILRFPVTPQYLSRVPAEAIVELDDDDIGISLNRIFDHAPVFFPIVTSSRHNVHKVANRYKVVTLAVFPVPALLGIERTVINPGLARCRDPEVPNCPFSCECSVQVSILLVILMGLGEVPLIP